MNIRRGVFETNSSSSHVVVIDRGATDFEPVWLCDSEDQTIVIEQGDYGWGIEVLRDWRERASYALTHAANNPAQADMLRRVIGDFTGRKVRFGAYAGYIDHQSAGRADEAFESETVLKQFLFGDRSLVVIDNDNH